jgi:hypothetical protein
MASNLEPGLRLLALAYPEFSIGQSDCGRHGPAWTVIRKDPAQPGLYAAVTPDLDELRDILARHATQQPDGGDREPDQPHRTANAALPEHERTPAMPQATRAPMPPTPRLAKPMPACRRNRTSPADRALAAIVKTLAENGYHSSVPAWDGHAYLRISNARQAHADLTITPGGDLTWHYRSVRYPGPSERSLIAAAIELLDPGTLTPLPAPAPDHLNLTPLGAIRHALAGHGLTAAITQPDAGTGPLLNAASPRKPYRGTITITSDGELTWTTRTPDHPDPGSGLHLRETAAAITRALTQADHPATRHQPEEPA